MSKLDNLKEKYPLLFPEKEENLPFNDWGFECGEGWFDILDAAFNEIYRPYLRAKRSLEYAVSKELDEDTLLRYTEDLEKAKSSLPVVEQIKSKFGTLRLYCRNENDISSTAISMAEYLSGVVCERCGNSGTITAQGWRSSLCKLCSEKIAAKQSTL